MPRRMAKQTGNPGGGGDVAGRVGPKSVERVTQLTAVGNRGDSSLSVPLPAWLLGSASLGSRNGSLVFTPQSQFAKIQGIRVLRRIRTNR